MDATAQGAEDRARGARGDDARRAGDDRADDDADRGAVESTLRRPAIRV